MVFGEVVSNGHTLMSMFLILLCLHILHLVYHLATDVMNSQRKISMTNEYVKLSTLHLHLSCYLQLVVWHMKQQFFTNVLLRVSPPNGINLIAPQCPGCDVVFNSLSSVPLFNVYVVLVLPVAKPFIQSYHQWIWLTLNFILLIDSVFLYCLYFFYCLLL